MSFIQTVNNKELIAFAIYPYSSAREGNIYNYEDSDWINFTKPRWKNYTMDPDKLLTKIFKMGNNEIAEYTTIGAGGICWSTITKLEGDITVEEESILPVNNIYQLLYVAISKEQFESWYSNEPDYTFEDKLIIYQKTVNSSNYAILPLTPNQLDLNTLELRGKHAVFGSFNTKRKYLINGEEETRSLQYGFCNKYLENNNNKTQLIYDGIYNYGVGMPIQMYVQYNKLANYGWTHGNDTYFQFRGNYFLDANVSSDLSDGWAPLKLTTIPVNGQNPGNGYRWCLTISGTDIIVIDEYGELQMCPLTIDYSSGTPQYETLNRNWHLYNAYGERLTLANINRPGANVIAKHVYVSNEYFRAATTNEHHKLPVYYYWNKLDLDELIQNLTQDSW